MARKYWTFTLNNPTNNETVVDLEDTFMDHVNYACFQLEKGDNNTVHYQGFLKLKRSRLLSYLKKLLKRAHWEPVRAVEACRRYCMKDDTRMEGPWEIGEWIKSKQGKRNDLLALKKRVLEGERPSVVKRQCTNHQQVRFLEAMAGLVPLSHDYKQKTVIWHWGETGTGKTRTAMEACPPDDTWHGLGSSQWFDGYEGQKYVIIDEIRAKNWSYDMMLRLLDGYELRVPIKGGFTTWKPETIYVTCPYKPSRLYAGTIEHHGSIDQLLRRITQITEFTLE